MNENTTLGRFQHDYHQLTLSSVIEEMISEAIDDILDKEVASWRATESQFMKAAGC